jgi:hypothetical protein
MSDPFDLTAIREWLETADTSLLMKTTLSDIDFL